MGVDWARRAERCLDQDLPWRIGDVVFTANDVSNRHLPIIHHDGEMIKWFVETLGDDEVAELSGVEADIPANQISEGNFNIWISKSNYFTLLTRLVTFLYLFF